MANPNIVNVAAIYGNNALLSLSTTSATSIASNPAASGKIFKVNSIVVSNSSNAGNYIITINLYSAAALGGTAYPIAKEITVPANSTLIVTDKTTAFYLKEDQSVGATATTANTLTVTASWEEINA